jgi:hypothetical protein
MYYYNFISHLYVFGLKNIEHKQPTSMFQNTPLTLIFSKLFFPLKQVCSVWEIHFFSANYILSIILRGKKDDTCTFFVLYLEGQFGVLTTLCSF